MGQQITAIHHVAIICSDYDRSKHFYTQILGFQVLNETYRAERDSYKLDLQVGDRDRLELFSFPNPPARPSYPEACGLRHLAFAVENLDVEVTILTQNGIQTEPIRIDPITQQRFTFFQDPDGLPLELYESTLCSSDHGAA